MTFSSKSLSLRGLRTFCVAAEYGSFREAAERLYITPSAVSHQVKNLEDELGLRLFERLPRAVVLTVEGGKLFEELRPLIVDIDTVTRRHRRLGVRQTLRISVQPFFASELFIPSLAGFTAQHPDIDLKVDTSDESAEKHPATADVSIRVFRHTPSSLAADRLFALRLVPASAPGFLKSIRCKGNKVTGEFPRIVHDSRPGAWKAWQELSEITLPEDSKLIRLDSMIAVARAAEKGLGAALVPVQLSDSWFESGSLVQLFPYELPTRDAYYLVCRHEDRQRPEVGQLRDWALQKFGDLD